MNVLDLNYSLLDRGSWGEEDKDRERGGGRGGGSGERKKETRHMVEIDFKADVIFQEYSTRKKWSV